MLIVSLFYSTSGAWTLLEASEISILSFVLTQPQKWPASSNRTTWCQLNFYRKFGAQTCRAAFQLVKQRATFSSVFRIVCTQSKHWWTREKEISFISNAEFHFHWIISFLIKYFHGKHWSRSSSSIETLNHVLHTKSRV